MIVKLDATTAYEARQEIARRWPDQDVYYQGRCANGELTAYSLVRRSDKSSGHLGGKPKKPGPVIVFYAEIGG